MFSLAVWFGENAVEKESDLKQSNRKTFCFQGGPDDPQPRTSRTCLGIFEGWRIKSRLGPERSLRTSSGIVGTVTSTRRAGGPDFLCTHKVRRVILRSSLISLAPVLYLTSPFSNVSLILSSFHILHSNVSHISLRSRPHSFAFSQLFSPFSVLSSLISVPTSPCTSLSSLVSIFPLQVLPDAENNFIEVVCLRCRVGRWMGRWRGWVGRRVSGWVDG